MKTLLIACLALLSFAGCSKKQADAVLPADPTKVVGNWVLIDPASAYNITLKIATAPVLMAGFDAYRFTGYSSVNSYFADAQFSKGPSIESGEAGTGGVFALGSTRMGGPPAAMQFETDYFARLVATDRVALTSAGRLTLHYALATPGELVFKRQ